MRAHVVHDIAGTDYRGDGTLYAGFMFAAPETCFFRNTQMHPEPAREARLHLKPSGAAWQDLSPDEILGVVQPGLPLWPTTRHRGDDTYLENEISAINN